YPHFLGAEWDHGFRARRILALLQAKPKLSLEDMQRIQNDAYLVFADDLLALMGNFVPNDADAAEAWRRLSEWDRAAERDSVGALIFETFWLQLAHALFDDELGDDEELIKLAIGTGTETRLAVLNAVADPNAPWWDDRRTPEQETREEILNRALQRTLERLRARFGSNPQEWRWGRAHQVIFRNLTLGRSGVAPIEALFNRGPFPVSGASAAINNNGYRDESFAVTSGPSWRLIADLADLRRSLAIHTTGQSGHAFHPHYDDMIPLWLEGRYNPLLWQREDVLQHAAATLVLQPQP
ncbi:MAG: penicillin acylase family protein, partial [Thermoflexales bacterium]|nr:penicillin acylase family protein [Thermoflexales bacterium]